MNLEFSSALKYLSSVQLNEFDVLNRINASNFETNGFKIKRVLKEVRQLSKPDNILEIDVFDCLNVTSTGLKFIHINLSDTSFDYIGLNDLRFEIVISNTTIGSGESLGFFSEFTMLNINQFSKNLFLRVDPSVLAQVDRFLDLSIVAGI